MIDLMQQTHSLADCFTKNLPSCGDCPYFKKDQDIAYCSLGFLPSLFCPGADLQNTPVSTPMSQETAFLAFFMLFMLSRNFNPQE